MTPHEAQTYLNSFINYELNLKTITLASFKLKRMETLLELLGRPQDKIRFIHVAGTKGKGSTCAFTAHILKSAGYKVGLYTSPHLKDVKERIRVLENSLSGCGVVDFAPAKVASSTTPQPDSNGEIFSDCIRDEEMGSLLEKMKPSLEKLRSTPQYGQLSYFEVLTALAFCYFEQRQVDFAILETGLGGRLDATNVVQPLVCGLTPISIEHTQQLGETLEAIAAEKAAIIKGDWCPQGHQSAVVVAPQPPEALAVIQRRCSQQGLSAYLVGRDMTFKRIHQDIDGQSFHVQGIHGKYDLKTQLLGIYQIMNAATAVGLVESLAAYGVLVTDKAIQKGIAETLWPGRLEILRQRPYVILDGAHNPDSSQKVAQAVREIFPRKKITLILGLSDDKDKFRICRNFDEISNEVILTSADHPRASHFTDQEMESIFKTKKCVRTNNVREALKTALTKTGKEDVILVTGSMFVVSEAREICIN